MNAAVQGVLLGGGYALIACGLSLTFGVMRLVNLAHGDFAVCGAYLALVLAHWQHVPAWYTLPLLLPAAALAGAALHVTVLKRALRGGELSPVLVTFGLSVVIENLLLVYASADTRGLPGGAWSQASIALPGDVVVSWIRLTGLLTALVVLGGLQLLLARSAWGRRVRATADDPDTARLVGIRIRPLLAGVAAIAVATAALAGVFLGLISGFDPQSGGLILIFAFEAVVIGGIGSLWGTLIGGIALGLTQQLVGQWHAQYAVLAVHLLFLLVLAVRRWT
ncbi:branched-chain amino acid ABC transporter permease [Actinoplanes sp. NPDC051851]|uniref:branched-chain amino acid ABC transporter permease n=1 Tax=Actinoplanes sp. NPDC051851 TaxID=3154753 RepID=UPI00343E9462